MREATQAEFQAALARAGWPAPRYMHSRRSTTVVYSDRGTEVAERTTLTTRGKVTSEHYLVNPAFLDGGSIR